MEIEAKKSLLLLFGKKLHKIRSDKGISYRELAQLCDVDHSQISKIEKGLVSLQLTTLFELAKGLEIHPQKLLDIDFDGREL
ncbi:helix-turn-helix domain-containing protein [Flavivirga jejuensis]|uniref:Helix-turn-helix transcriptional regulator n=1 Tax=Flavivirga jejuensis TaxID=870487 RepID=A0ABT8WIB3_9FLAO|nr:helix-turn-helix transcriptional regulator [Flavivirga jejuensis]MDO5972865.1 helix-turn-helix transcriptional regulator [Flavivirga jejuensis]